MVALHTLDEQQRAALGLALFGEHAYHEVAALLGVPAATVLHLLRSGLRDIQTMNIQPAGPAAEDGTDIQGSAPPS